MNVALLAVHFTSLHRNVNAGTELYTRNQAYIKSFLCIIGMYLVLEYFGPKFITVVCAHNTFIETGLYKSLFANQIFAL